MGELEQAGPFVDEPLAAPVLPASRSDHGDTIHAGSPPDVSSAAAPQGPAGTAAPASVPRLALGDPEWNGDVVSLVKPDYPREARNAKVFGTVRVEVAVHIDGKVSSARIISGPPLLRSAARSAALRARFRPLPQGGIQRGRTKVLVYNFLAPN